MAEALGLVSSVISVAELAARIATSTMTLKRLWDDVKDVPEEVNTLMEQLELLSHFIAEMENQLVQTPEPKTKHLTTTNQGLVYCRRAVAGLEGLIEDIQSQLFSKRKLKRKIAQTKVSLKREQIQSYQKKLQNALQLLSLSQQSYLIFQSTTILSELQESKAKDHVSTEPYQQDTIQDEIQSMDLPKRSVDANSWVNLKQLPWRKTKYLWSFAYHAAEVSCGTFTTSSAIYQARLQLPSWMLKQVWDIQVQNACDGWKILLRPWNIRPFETPAFYYAARGLLSDLLMEMKHNRASIYDRDPHGWTLLHFAAVTGQLETGRTLIQMGLSPYEPTWSGVTPAACFSRSKNHRNTMLEIYRALLTHDALDEARDDFLHHGGRECNLDFHIWRIPGLFFLITDKLALSLYQLFGPMFRAVLWKFVDPSVMLSILQHIIFLSPADFHAHLRPLKFLHRFSEAYFDRILDLNTVDPRKSESKNSVQSWRLLARWVFTGARVQDIAMIEEGDGWPFGTPLMYALRTCFGNTKRSSWQAPDKFTMAMRMWLEDLLVSGVDLRDYGRHELVLFNSDKWLSSQRWDYIQPRHQEWTRGPRMSFSFGALPEDWAIHWDPAVEEYAKDFWEMVDDPPPLIPGAWIDDEELSVNWDPMNAALSYYLGIKRVSYALEL